MSVIRVEKNKNYTVMSNYHLRDKNLSLKAKGLLSVVLSLPDNWNYSIEGLVSTLKEEKRAVKSAINELIKNKYLVILKFKAVKGVRNNIEYMYTFYEEPFNNKEYAELLGSINRDELIEYKHTAKANNVSIHNVDTQKVDIQKVDIQNVCLHNDTQISKEEISKEEINTEIIKKEDINNINNTNNNSGGGDLSILSNKLDQKLSIYEYVERNFGRPLSPVEYQKINTWEDNELTRYAVEVAVLNNIHKISYIEGILRNFKDNDIHTVSEAKEFDKKLHKKRNIRTKFIPFVYRDNDLWFYKDESGKTMFCDKPYLADDGEWKFKNGYGEELKCSVNIDDLMEK